MFLIYSPPRCGSTKLIYELDSRLNGDDVAICEPANISIESRDKFGSDYTNNGTEGLRKWISKKTELRGIKMISTAYPELKIDHRQWVEKNLDLFDRIIILNRDPVEIAISLHIARHRKIWNILDDDDNKRDLTTAINNFSVDLQTMTWVEESVNSCRRVAEQCPNKSINAMFPDFLSNIGDLAAFVNLPRNPQRRHKFNVLPVRASSDIKLQHCMNRSDIESFFISRLCHSSSNKP